jgi:hypothetical protein
MGNRLNPAVGRAVTHGHRDHAVQFYRDDASLMKTLSKFLRDGLTAGQPLVVIATREHRAALTARMVEDGMQPNQFERGGGLWMLDARETLETFMVDGQPDPELFRVNVGSVIAAARGPRPAALVRTYGEMVDVLWKDGQPEAAIRLEVLWNALAASEHFTLLCAYAIGNFYKQTGGFDIGDVCDVHTHVLPA